MGRAGFDRRAFKGEEKLTSAILRATHKEQTAVVFTRYGGTPLFLGRFMPGQPPAPYTSMKQQLEDANFIVEEWDVKSPTLHASDALAPGRRRLRDVPRGGAFSPHDLRRRPHHRLPAPAPARRRAVLPDVFLPRPASRLLPARAVGPHVRARRRVAASGPGAPIRRQTSPPTSPLKNGGIWDRIGFSPSNSACTRTSSALWMPTYRPPASSWSVLPRRVRLAGRIRRVLLAADLRSPIGRG